MLRHGTGLVLGLAMLMVAGCGAVTDAPGAAFRDTGQPLSVTTRGNGISDMGGPWFLRAHFPGDGGLAMVTFLPDLNGAQAVEMRHEACLLSGDCETGTAIWRADPLGLNRWRLTEAESGETKELWVIWVDDGFRTAAIGAPDGRYGWIIDRRPEGGEDRLAAAAEILAFNGYDVARMKAK